MANHKVVEIPASNIKKDITRILFDKGYILNYKFEDEGVQGNIKIALKYNAETKTPAVISTSQGVMTDKEARKLNIGGEVLCYVY